MSCAMLWYDAQHVASTLDSSLSNSGATTKNKMFKMTLSLFDLLV